MPAAAPVPAAASGTAVPLSLSLGLPLALSSALALALALALSLSSPLPLAPSWSLSSSWSWSLSSSLSVPLRRLGHGRPIAIDLLVDILVKLFGRSLVAVGCVVGKAVVRSGGLLRPSRLAGAIPAGAAHPGRLQQPLQITVLQLDLLAALQLRRHGDHSVANPDETAHHQTERLEQTAHFTVASFRQRDLVPVVRPFAALVGKRGDPSHAVVELHALAQRVLLLRGEGADHAHRIFAFDLVARMHQPIGELARGREQQQPLAVEIEPAHGDPLGASKPRQLLEHGRTAFRVGPAHDLAGRLVIQQHAGARRREAQPHELAVDADLVVRPDLLSDLRRHAVHGDPSGDDH